LDAYREIIPTLIRQLKEPNYYAMRELPSRPLTAPDAGYLQS
jgi:hypothetical protein